VDKPEILALNKADALTPEQLKQQVARLKRVAKTSPLIVSGATGQGVTEVIRALATAIDQAAAPARERSPTG
jgi:GTP-binding protein